MAIFVMTLPALNALVQLGMQHAEETRILATASLMCRSKMAEVTAGSVPFSSSDWAPLDDPTWQWKVDTSNASGVSGMQTVQVSVKLDVGTGQNFEQTLVQMVLDPSLRGSTQDRYLLDPAGSTSSRRPPRRPQRRLPRPEPARPRPARREREQAAAGLRREAEPSPAARCRSRRKPALLPAVRKAAAGRRRRRRAARKAAVVRLAAVVQAAAVRAAVAVAAAQVLPGAAAAREAADDHLAKSSTCRLHAARDVARPGDRAHHPRRGLRVPQSSDLDGRNRPGDDRGERAGPSDPRSDVDRYRRQPRRLRSDAGHVRRCVADGEFLDDDLELVVNDVPRLPRRRHPRRRLRRPRRRRRRRSTSASRGPTPASS